MNEPKDPPDEPAATKLHDALFRRTFSNPVHMEGELRAMLPASLVSKLDFATLRVLSGSYVDEDLRSKESDLLLSVQLAERPALIYVLCEHQSQANRRMPLRLLGYLVRIWERHAAQHPAGALPPIVPLVVHHDHNAWSAPTYLRTLFSLDDSTQELLAPYLPDFTFILDDLASISPAVLHARATLSALAKLVLFALQRARHAPSLPDEFTAFFDTLNELAVTEGGPRDLAVVFRYISDVADVSAKQIFQTVGEGADPQVREVLMTMTQQLLAEGRAEGRADTLAKQLSMKFGALPAETHARLYAATQEELDRWTEQVLFAGSFEDALR